MAEAEKRSQVPENLKPFFQRASEAEERLTRLEGAVESKKYSGNEEHLETISELQSKLEASNAKLLLEQKKGQDLEAENSKLQYRIKHLVRAIREAEEKSEQSK